MAPRLLLITQWFDPEPTTKGLLFARELSKRGFDVEVVTGFPNYPGGRLYPGYRIRGIQREVVDGVRITRLPLYPSHNHSRLGRALNYLSFGLAVVAYGLLGAERPSVMYAYHPPLTVGIAGTLIRLFRRVPLVLDIQDVWPESLQSTGMIRSRVVLKGIGWLCDLVYRIADQIVVLSPGFKTLLIDRGVPASKLKVIFNWADENAPVHDEMFTLPDNFSKRESFVVLFAGNMGSAQALESAVEAAAKLERSGESVDFVFLGTGVRIAALKSLAASLRLSNVHFLPPVPMSQVGAYLAAADTLLVHLRRDPLFEITIPSKTQAYLAAGRPIIMAVPGDAAHIIDRSGGGVNATPEDPESLVQAVRTIMSMDPVERVDMGRRGRAFYTSQLSMKAGIDSFAILFRSLTSANESSSPTAR